MSTSAALLSLPADRQSPDRVCGGTRGLSHLATVLASQSIDCVLAVVVSTTGASARVRGAMGLFDASGYRAGSLAGGSLQQRLGDATRSVLNSGKAELVSIDAAHDSSNASGLPSDAGTIQILMLPMPASDSPLREALGNACDRCAWLRVRVDLGDENASRGELGFGEARTGPDLYAFDRSGHSCDGPLGFSRAVSLSFAPPPRIALVGCGPESRPIARLAHLVGWYVEAIDSRRDALMAFAGDAVDFQHAVDPEELVGLLAERHFDAVILGGHDLDLDGRNLVCLGASGVGYVGLLGAPERRDALLSRVGDIIATQLELRLYAPAGLSLGGDGPEAAALSIIAQLQHYLAHDVHV
ncbi:XdhC family protein [Dokdonella sp.]|uniref:XdhC family protein n=1 Tax=Dokdonella sp. TaxID=2291710 RepID=UPI003C4FB434